MFMTAKPCQRVQTRGEREQRRKGSNARPSLWRIRAFQYWCNLDYAPRLLDVRFSISKKHKVDTHVYSLKRREVLFYRDVYDSTINLSKLAKFSSFFFFFLFIQILIVKIMFTHFVRIVCLRDASWFFDEISWWNLEKKLEKFNLYDQIIWYRVINCKGVFKWLPSKKEARLIEFIRYESCLKIFGLSELKSNSSCRECSQVKFLDHEAVFREGLGMDGEGEGEGRRKREGSKERNNPKVKRKVNFH